MKQKILLTGGTGFVGKTLGKKLVEEGYDVVVVTRDPQKHIGLLPYPCTIVSWKNLSDFLKNNKIQNVVHLAGESVAGSRWTEDIKKEISHSRIKVTENLVDILKKNSIQLDSFVSASAIGFYGDRENESLTEESKEGSGFLPQVCSNWEKETFKYRDHSAHSRIVALRIGIVLGVGGGALSEMLTPFRDGFGAALGTGKQWMSWIHIHDLVNLIVWMLKNGNGVYNAVSTNPIQNIDFSKTLASHFKSKLFPKIPKIAMGILFGEMSQVLLSSQKVYPKKALDEGFVFKFTDLGEALKSLYPSLSAYESIAIFEQWVPYSIKKVFPFYQNEQNLEYITPPWLHFKVLGKTTSEIQKGTILDYKLTLKGIPVSWKTLIEEFHLNHKFIDRQLNGPYEIWHHTHDFETLGSGTLVRDTVRYKVRFGALGYFASSWMVHKDIRRIFNYRSQVISKHVFD